MALRPTPSNDAGVDLERIRKEQAKPRHARLRIMIAGDPNRPIRTISLPRRLPLIASVVVGTLALATVVLACGSWKLSDALTGLGNLRLYQACMAAEHARFARYGEPLSLVVIDVDKLKRINDEHGHLAGNEALRAIADVIRREAREVDVAARYGGDEFLVVLPHTTLPRAGFFADRVRDAVRQLTVHGVRLSVSIGVAALSRPGSTETADDLLQRADAAAYRAKRDGGDRTCLDGG